MVAASSAALGRAAVATVAAAAIGLLPRPSASSHSGLEFSPFFSQMMVRVCGGVPSSFIELKVGREGKGPN